MIYRPAFELKIVAYKLPLSALYATPNGYSKPLYHLNLILSKHFNQTYK